MANASHKHAGAGAQGKNDGTGAMTDLDPADIPDNMVLSNRDKAQHGDQRGLDGAAVQTEQLRDHAAARAVAPEEAVGAPLPDEPAGPDEALDPDAQLTDAESGEDRATLGDVVAEVAPELAPGLAAGAEGAEQPPEDAALDADARFADEMAGDRRPEPT